MTKEDYIKRRMETNVEEYSPDHLPAAVLGKRNKTTYNTKHSKSHADIERLNCKASRKAIVIVGSRLPGSR